VLLLLLLLLLLLRTGWLDVPKHARKGAFIVNCAISPCVSHNDWYGCAGSSTSSSSGSSGGGTYDAVVVQQRSSTQHN
jgi:hypothetical protein